MDKTNSQPQILDKEQFLKQERQVFFVWGLMVILAILLGFGWSILGQNERLWAQVTDFPNLSRAHSMSITYDADDLPPAGGDHRPTWQNCGIYDYPPDPAQVVHSLEHGAVWLAYRPSLPAVKVTALETLVSGQTDVIMSPYPELSGDVVMSAWGKQLVIESFPDERITEFIERFRGNGPEVGPICSSGAGTPLQAGGHL